MIQFYINPKFRFLSTEIEGIPQHDYVVEKTFRNRRNTVELVRIWGEEYVVKRYKRPTLANCVVYTLLRKSKAERAFNNAFYLKQHGIETAEPVAYIEQSKCGFFHTGWFISRYLPYKDVREVCDSITDVQERKQFREAFMKFTNELCERHIMNKDYNSGNVLAYKKDGEYHFVLIDISRLKIHRLSTFDECKALMQLKLKGHEVSRVLSSFARISGKGVRKLAFFYNMNIRLNNHRHSVKCNLKRILSAGRLKPCREAAI